MFTLFSSACLVLARVSGFLSCLNFCCSRNWSNPVPSQTCDSSLKPFLIAALCLICSLPLSAQMQKPDVLINDLKNPWGVAVRPTTGIIYVSDTGRGRIVSLEYRNMDEVIVDFPLSEYKLDAGIVLAPLGLIFRGNDTLIVGTGGGQDGDDGISIFDVRRKKKDPIKADDPDATLKLFSDEKYKPEGDFFSLAITRAALYSTCGGDVDQGWLARAEMRVGEIKNFRRYIPTRPLSHTANPGGVCISPQGHIVVSQMGSRDKPGDSLLTFYSPLGELLDKFPTGLSDVVAIAYGPRKRRLYALDFNWANPREGGLYKLVSVDTDDGCEAKLIARLQRPTAMAFDRKGNLYVTTCGFGAVENRDLAPDQDVFEHDGKLVVFRDLD